MTSTALADGINLEHLLINHAKLPPLRLREQDNLGYP
jgi:hypothetical protein